jgi:hypothetical protein
MDNGTECLDLFARYTNGSVTLVHKSPETLYKVTYGRDLHSIRHSMSERIVFHFLDQAQCFTRYEFVDKFNNDEIFDFFHMESVIPKFFFDQSLVVSLTILEMSNFVQNEKDLNELFARNGGKGVAIQVHFYEHTNRIPNFTAKVLRLNGVRRNDILILAPVSVTLNPFAVHFHHNHHHLLLDLPFTVQQECDTQDNYEQSLRLVDRLLFVRQHWDRLKGQILYA